MFMYAPLSKAITESSLWETPSHVRVLFITMISKMDRDSVVRLDERGLYRAANLPYEQFKEAMKVLMEPDRTDPGFEQPFEGRRVEKVEGGWVVLNGKKYQEEMVAANRRAREAEKKRRQRARAKMIERAKEIGLSVGEFRMRLQADGKLAAYEKAFEAGDEEEMDRLTAPLRKEGE